jgi:hypothetical protein
MKRILSFGAVSALGVLLGCPIYGDDSSSNPSSCSSSADCPTGYTCNPQNQCQQGDCSQTGCSNGATCTLQNDSFTCIANNSDGGNLDGNVPQYSGCFQDTDCTGDGGTGAKCLNAQCTLPDNQCADETQCANNEQCVQGVCTPPCSATVGCPTGYSCDLTNNVCTGNSSACTIPGGSCGGGSDVCVEQHCVAPCGTSNSCSDGLVCVNGGCMPDQLPHFTCTQEGVQDVCATGSICLRHNCYISCASNPNVCQTASEFNICKTVTTESGSYQVCGSNSNLGSDCDPTIGKNCPNNGICIDGYCH